jgi:hypothetical protein
MPELHTAVTDVRVFPQFLQVNADVIPSGGPSRSLHIHVSGPSRVLFTSFNGT